MAAMCRQVMLVCEKPLQTTVTAAVLLNEYLPLIQQCITTYWTAETTPTSPRMMLVATVIYAAVETLTYCLISHVPVQPFVLFYTIALIVPAVQFLIIKEFQVLHRIREQSEKAFTAIESTRFVRWAKMPYGVVYYTINTAMINAGLRHYALDLSINSADFRATEALYVLVFFLIMNLALYGLVMFFNYAIATINVPKAEHSRAAVLAVMKTIPWIAIAVFLRTILRYALNETTLYKATTAENNAWMVEVPKSQAAFYSQDRLQWLKNINGIVPQWVLYIFWSACILQHLPWRRMTRYVWSRVKRQDRFD